MDKISNQFLAVNDVYCGDSTKLLSLIEPDSIALSVWSPPYHVGKKYEEGQTYEEWLIMLSSVIESHYRVLKPGGFLAINIGDILVYYDEKMPKIQASTVSLRRIALTTEDVLKAKQDNPTFNKHQLAALLGCSEQTIDRRLNGNNIRGGKYATQSRVKIVGGLIEEMALDAGLYTYDRRIWVKDPAWANCRWSSNSYRSIDEFEYIYIFWKPGITKVDRARLSDDEWANWGSRGVWNIQSVRKNDIHEAMFPIELPSRLIRLLTDKNDIVLDCFMGSGTTAVAAVEWGRRYIGIDKEEKYVSIAKKKVESHKAQIRMDI